MIKYFVLFVAGFALISIAAGACDASTCVSDECAERHCSEGECVTRSLLQSYLCYDEECDNGRKRLVQKDLSEVCPIPTDNLCQVASCVFDFDDHSADHCEYSPKPPPDTGDPCIQYTCDPKTGQFDSAPVCNDGDPCTVDQCTIFGECRFVPVDCYSEIDMSGYECYRATCVPNDDGTHKCVRRLIPGCAASDPPEPSNPSETSNPSAGSTTTTSNSAGSATPAPQPSSVPKGGSISGAQSIHCTKLTAFVSVLLSFLMLKLF